MIREPQARDAGARSIGRRRRALVAVVVVSSVVLLLANAAFWFVGDKLFRGEHQDALRPVDAIVVLGGEHDGREDYGLQLARDGYANTVLISNPYINDEYAEHGQSLMERVCSSGTDKIEVICFAPDPSTTRGEAMFTEKLAKERGWKSVIVVSWRYHLVRARYIFGQCFSGDVVMRSVPRDYSRPVDDWAFQYMYQFGGIAKAAILRC